MTTLLLLSLLVFAFTGSGAAQSTIPILVGKNGSFFDPDSVNARMGDTVQFKFFDAPHGVVQTSFETPCQPLQGGFSSGVVAPTEGEGEIAEWNLLITNTSQTIWFYCPLTRPVPHCSSGMIGAINPFGEMMVDQFRSAAKAFTGTPPPPSTVLSGIGAIATAAPVSIVGTAPPSFQTDSSTTSSGFSSKVESTSSSTSVPETSSNHTPAIVGGTVAGLVALFATIIVIVFIIRRRRPSRPSSPQRHHTVESQYFPQPISPPPSSGASDTFMGKQSQPQTQFYPVRGEAALPSIAYGYGRNDSSDRPSSSSKTRAPEPFHIRNQGSQGNLTTGAGILRAVSSSERIHQQHLQQQHPYAAPGVNAGVDVAEVEPGGERTENIHALAKEVAAVLLREQTSLVVPSPRRDGHGSRTGSSGNSEGPPPDYKSRGHI